MFLFYLLFATIIMVNKDFQICPYHGDRDLCLIHRYTWDRTSLPAEWNLISVQRF